MSAAVTTASAGAGELVPIADRLRYMQLFRLVLIAVVAGAAALARDALDASITALVAVSAAYLVVTALTTLTSRMSRTGAQRIFGLALMLDGVYLGWASYATGGAGSPVRYLIVLHLIAVALLASYRTGMKLAMWHSLLLLVVYYAQQAGLLRPLDDDTALGGVGGPFEQLLAFSAVFWLVAVVTAGFSAVNERELRRRRYDLEALAAMARRLEEVEGSSSVADAVLDRVCDTFDVDRGAVIAAPDGRELTVLARRGEVVAAGAGTDAGDAVRGAMRSGETRLLKRLDPEGDAGLAAILPGAANLVIVPLTAGGLPLGVLVIEHPLRAGSRIERRVVGMLERFAAHASLALRNAWLLEEIQHVAATDSLTGLANRATFERVLGKELARVQRNGGSAALVLLDLDHFKRLNDTFGHQTGDAVLQRVAGVLDDTCRSFDTPVRYGGEEFAVVLPHTTPEEAAEVAERLREGVAGAGTEPAVTVSVGFACFPADAADADALVEAADLALYASKRGGRDRVTAARHAALSEPEQV